MPQLSVGLLEAAQMIGVSHFTLRRMVKKGRLKSARVGRRIVIRMEELEKLTKQGATTVSVAK